LGENITEASMESEAYTKSHKIDMSIHWYETDDESVPEKLTPKMSDSEIIRAGYKEILDIRNHIDEPISNGKISKQLSKGRECQTNGSEEDNQNHFIC
jgi:hypothetical protein